MQGSDLGVVWGQFKRTIHPAATVLALVIPAERQRRQQHGVPRLVGSGPREGQFGAQPLLACEQGPADRL